MKNRSTWVAIGLLSALLAGGGCQQTSKNVRKPPPLQHSQRVLVLDRQVSDVLVFVNSVQRRMAGGQIFVQANFQNRLAGEDLWAEVKFEFQDANNMLVDETEWVNTLFSRGEVTMVQGNSISGKAVKHVMLLRNLLRGRGRVPTGGGSIYAVPGTP